MTEYRCPYCGQDSYAKSSKKSGFFLNWKVIRNHLIKCKLNDTSYTICENYGPLKWDLINSYKSINHFKKDYPNISFDSNFFKTFRKLGKTNLKEIVWSKELIIEKLQEFHTRYSKIPQHRELDNLTPDYPSKSIIIRHFITFNKAIEAAGLIPNYNDGYGNRTIGKDGRLYRSQAEAYFVDHFLYAKEEYEYEKPYGNGWFYDFYLPKHNLYIELDGGFTDSVDNYRSKINKKIQYCKDNNITLIVIDIKTLYQKDFKLRV